MNTQPEDLETFVDRTTKMLELADLEGRLRRVKKKLNEWDPDEAYAVAHLEKAAADVRFARLAIKRKRSKVPAEPPTLAEVPTTVPVCKACGGRGYTWAPPGNDTGPFTDPCAFCEGRGTVDG